MLCFVCFRDFAEIKTALITSPFPQQKSNWRRFMCNENILALFRNTQTLKKQH